MKGDGIYEMRVSSLRCQILSAKSPTIRGVHDSTCQLLFHVDPPFKTLSSHALLVLDSKPRMVLSISNRSGHFFTSLTQTI